MSYVAKFTFNQTTEIINQAKLLICCDGGLMHAANAVETPIIPLFARLQEQMQLTSSIKAFPIFDPTNVNNILVKAEGKKLYFSATNLEIAISYFVEADVRSEGAITIPAKLITSYV